MIKHTISGKYTALFTATGLLAINFWAWSLISPLATGYMKEFGLSSFELSLLVSAPVLIGSLGRIPIGILADKFGGRRLLAVLCILTSVDVIGLSFANSQVSLMAAAVGLGLAGASFAAGAPYVNSWFKERQRGLALGMYAVGNAGTALSGMLTPHLAASYGRGHTFWFVAALLLISGLAMGLFGRDAPGWRPATTSSLSRIKQAWAWKMTRRLALLYALTFGAFVTLGLYLPIVLNQSYKLSVPDAAARAAGFVLLATLVRPLGGWLSDRLNGVIILQVVFFSVAALATVAAINPPLAPVGTIAYLGMATALGIGNGAVFAIIGHRCKGALVGTVTGLVGAAGGIGGYFPPLVMGASFQLFHSYSAALGLLALVAFVIFLNARRLLGSSSSY
jgi:NNP family nitrate/nitrite transporter-like MFS transporter